MYAIQYADTKTRPHDRHNDKEDPSGGAAGSAAPAPTGIAVAVSEKTTMASSTSKKSQTQSGGRTHLALETCFGMTETVKYIDQQAHSELGYPKSGEIPSSTIWGRISQTEKPVPKIIHFINHMDKGQEATSQIASARKEIVAQGFKTNRTVFDLVSSFNKIETAATEAGMRSLQKAARQAQKIIDKTAKKIEIQNRIFEAQQNPPSISYKVKPSDPTWYSDINKMNSIAKRDANTAAITVSVAAIQIKPMESLFSRNKQISLIEDSKRNAEHERGLQRKEIKCTTLRDQSAVEIVLPTVRISSRKKAAPQEQPATSSSFVSMEEQSAYQSNQYEIDKRIYEEEKEASALALLLPSVPFANVPVPENSGRSERPRATAMTEKI